MSMDSIDAAREENPPAFETYMCEHCENVYTTETHTFYETEMQECVCSDCIARDHIYSDAQNTYILRADAITTEDGYPVSNDFATSACYHSAYNPDVLFYSGSRRDEYDSTLADEARSIYSYHQTNSIDVHGWPYQTPRNSLCFGVELEMENSDDDSPEGQDALCDALGGRDGATAIAGKYILMQDGSLDESGVELITCPYTLEFHQTSFGWKELLGRVASIGRSGKGTSACGMHVHVNRKALSPLTLGKMLVFVNADSTTRLIETIAQRDPSRWARRYAKSVRNGADRDSDKYEALHLTPKTVEFRIFRGNLRPDRVLKNIEFCHAVVMYCRDASMLDLDKPALFVSWLAKRKAQYPNLSAFLSNRSFASRLGRAANAQADARPSTAVTPEEDI